MNARPAEHPGPADPLEGLPAERAHETDLFRFGVDLYNRSFFWEAHEAWETVWQRCPEGPVRQALQGLIQLAAANLKEHLGVPSGALRLCEAGCLRLEKALREGATLGIDLADLTHRARRHFASIGNTRELSEPSPGIRMNAMQGRV